MPELSIEYLILFAVFVMPGAVSMYCYGLIFPMSSRDLKDKVLEAIVFSLLNFIMLFGVIRFLFDSAFIVANPVAAWVLAVLSLVIVPAIWPWLLRGCLRWLEQRKWIIVQAKTAWDDFFQSHSSGCWMIVDLADDKRVGGRFGSRSFASAWPEPGHLFIEELWDVNDDGQFVAAKPGAQGVLLRPTDYKRVTVLTEGANA